MPEAAGQAAEDLRSVEAPDGGDGIGDRLGKAGIQKTARLVQIDDTSARSAAPIAFR